MDKTLHMSIAFGRISSQQFWEAMRVQLAGPMAQAGADAELQQFAKTFEGMKFRKGRIAMATRMSVRHLRCGMCRSRAAVAYLATSCVM